MEASLRTQGTNSQWLWRNDCRNNNTYVMWQYSSIWYMKFISIRLAEHSLLSAKQTVMIQIHPDLSIF